MSEHTGTPTDSRTRVSRDLREIERLYELVLVQAINKGGARLMPGGEAMVSLGPVASPSAWEENIEYAEHRHLAMCPRLDHTRCRYAEHVDDQAGEPVLQTLLFWTEAWRAEAGYRLDRRPTVATEANFARGALDWAWEHEPHWDNFVDDVAHARTRLEDLLLAGVRSERGVPCLYDECRGVRLVRKLEPSRAEDGSKTWRISDWFCPKCHRRWTSDRYAAMVTAAHESTKFEDIEGETWCTTDYAARHVGRPESTIRAWLHRGQLSTVCLLAGRRIRYVSLGDVIEQSDRAGRRTRSA